MIQVRFAKQLRSKRFQNGADYLVRLKEIRNRFQFWNEADRLGPDFPLTHWRLYFNSTAQKLCKEKFRNFGEGSEFRPGAYAEACSKISIGKNVVIRAGTFLFADPAPGGAGIIIEDNVLIGPAVHFYTNNHKFSDINTPIINQGYSPPTEHDGIIVRRGSWIGASVILLPGVEIGENSVIGAGAVVSKPVPPHSLFVGNPGKVIRNLGRLHLNE
jgi:acetyltransferase-like isoleucine patch superfamily enzyme